MKYFWFPNIFDNASLCKFSRPSILFLVSLIARYSEEQRIKGFQLDENISSRNLIATYIVRISHREIYKLFGFCLSSIKRIEKELKDFVLVLPARILSIDKKYYRNEHEKRGFIKIDEYTYSASKLDQIVIGQQEISDPDDLRGYLVEELQALPRRLQRYLNIEYIYAFRIHTSNRSQIRVPVSLPYNRNMNISEKLAALWQIALKDSQQKPLSLAELALRSGISERTIRKAKQHYPGIFMKPRKAHH